MSDSQAFTTHYWVNIKENRKLISVLYWAPWEVILRSPLPHSHSFEWADCCPSHLDTENTKMSFSIWGYYNNFTVKSSRQLAVLYEVITSTSLFQTSPYTFSVDKFSTLFWYIANWFIQKTKSIHMFSFISKYRK